MVNYWLVGAPPVEYSRDQTLNRVSNALKGDLGTARSFQLPDGLKVGTLDALMVLSDQLVKMDASVLSVVRKVERTWAELVPEGEGLDFAVQDISKQSVPVTQYVNRFQWDDARYPKSKPLVDLAASIQEQAVQIDDDLKNKTSQYADLKAALQAIARKTGGNLLQRDLTEVLRPDVVERNDFVASEHFTTVVVVLQKGTENDFLNCYESLLPVQKPKDLNVVPRSAKRFNVDDKDGNTVWRVVCMVSMAEKYKQALRDAKFLPRDFEFSPSAHGEQSARKAQLEKEVRQQSSLLTRACKGSFSDLFSGYMHLKGIRLFVECVLRFGLPVNIAPIVVQPNGRNDKKAREALKDVWRHLDRASRKGRGGEEEGEDGEEEDLPYVLIDVETPDSSAGQSSR